MEPQVKTVTVPVRECHGGHIMDINLIWLCPVCGEERGEPFDAISYDGSIRAYVNGWRNACGHVDKYNAVRTEAENNGLN